MRRVFFLQLVPAVALGACAPHPRARPAPVPTRLYAEPPSRPTASAAPSAPRSPRAGELERWIAERDRLGDPGITFSRVAQTPPPRRYAVPKLGAFPERGRVARVVLYTFGRGRVAGCTDEARLPFTSAGTLCPDVVAPGVELEAEERRSVEELVPAAEAATAPAGKPSRPILRCGFDPHHAVAFFDQKGNVVAKMLVCFSCGEWLVSPGSDALGGSSPAMMTPHESESLAKLFDAHGLAAWPFGGPLADEVAAYERETYGTDDQPTPAGVERRSRRLARGSGAPRDTPVRELARADRRRLCDWVADEVRPAGSRQGFHGYECLDGRTWTSGATEPDCATTPTTCARTVREVEACLRVFREPDHLCQPPPPECVGVLECLPGIRLLQRLNAVVDVPGSE